MAAEHAELVETALASSPERVVAARSSEDDRKRKRDIPIVGTPGGGAIPGTVPSRNRRLGEWRGR